jgi:hypothetical protein
LQLRHPLSTIRSVRERSKHARLRDESSAPDPKREAEPARLRQALVERLDDIEDKLEHDLATDDEQRNAVQQLVGDVAREARDAGSRLLRTLSGPRTLAVRLAGALASPERDASGVDSRLRDAVADALLPLARGWLGLKLRSEIPLPQRGGVLVAFNRSGWPLPIEGMVVAGVVADRARRRDVYVMWDGVVTIAPGLAPALRRVGVLPAEPGVARSLLDRGAMVVCFPEGPAAGLKSYAERYKLAAFDDAFAIEEASEANAAIVPGAIVGHEESYPVVGHVAGVPLTPMFPLAGPLGLLPLPLGWRVRTGVPVPYDDDVNASAAAIEDVLRSRMQAMLSDMLRERRSIVRG